MKEKIISLTVGVLIGVPLAVYALGHNSKPEEYLQNENAVIYVVQADVQRNENETVMAAVPETIAIATTEAAALYNVPLSDDLQQYIIKLCEEKHIAPSLVFAIIDRESFFNETATGDNGQSLGLMQIQPRWNKKRMARLGCTNMLDAYQNVTVGIDILSEYFEQYSDIAFVLMAYNGGEAYAKNNMQKGIFETDYTKYVLEKSLEYSCDVAR